MKGALLPGTEPDPPRGERFDPGAFYDEHRAELVAFFDRTAQGLGIAEPAEDVYHDAWLKLVAHHERVDTLNPRRAVAWVKKVGTNILLDKVRDGYGKFEQPQPNVVIIGAESEHDAVNPAEQWVAREDLRRMVTKMPRKLAEVFVHDADGYSRDEIAEMLDLTPAAVQKRLTRARTYARNRLAIVAGFVPLGAVAHAARTVRRAVTKPAQAFVVSITYVSVVIAFVVPVLPGTVALPASATHRAVVRTPLPTVGNALAPTGKDAMSRPGTQPRPAAGAAHRPTKAKTTLPVPRVPSACAPGVCVGACPNRPQAGDRIYLKVIFSDPCSAGSSEQVTPVCQFVAENPVLGCHRDGDPEWKINPPPSPGGNPL
jgi:RNA polymerase sigma factor (sigma-70 family)